MRCGVPPYRKLTLAEAFDKSTVPNALGSSSKREQRGGFTRYAIAADPTRDLSSIEECGFALRSFGASWKACLRGVCKHWKSMNKVCSAVYRVHTKCWFICQHVFT